MTTTTYRAKRRALVAEGDRVCRERSSQAGPLPSPAPLRSERHSTARGLASLVLDMAPSAY